MRFSMLVLRNVLRRPGRSALTVSGMAVAVAAVVALVGIARGFERSLLAVYSNRGADLMVFRAGSMQRFSSVLDESLGAKIRRLPGVVDVSPMLFDVVSLEAKDLFGVVVQGLPRSGMALTGFQIVAGRPLEPGDGRVILLGRVLAGNLNKSVGENLEVVAGHPFRIVGIYESHNVFENGSMAMPLDQLQELMGRKGEVTSFAVACQGKDRDSLDALSRRIKTLAPALEAMPTREYIETSVEIRMARSVAWLTSTIALVIGTIGMINTMSTAVFERTRELAILRAIGWKKRNVIRLIVMESVMLGLAGAVVGTLAAIGLTQLLSNLPASGRLVSGDISLSVVLQGFAIALAVGVAGSLYPAYRAAKRLPTDGLRHE
jgi:putative ABC transport system permease protein